MSFRRNFPNMNSALTVSKLGGCVCVPRIVTRRRIVALMLSSLAVVVVMARASTVNSIIASSHKSLPAKCSRKPAVKSSREGAHDSTNSVCKPGSTSSRKSLKGNCRRSVTTNS